MGKTTKPLVILVHESLINLPEIQELSEKGHTVKVFEADPQPDILLGPTCWRMTHALKKYVKMAVDEARKVRYPPK